MTKPTFRRFIALVIDVIIVLVVTAALSSSVLFRKQYEKYDEATNKYMEVLEEVSTNPDKASEVLSDDNIKNISYDMTKKGAFINAISFVVATLYFIVFQYYTNGKTGGKALMKIEVISDDGKKLKLSQVIIRSLIANNLFMSAVVLFCVYVLSKGVYLKISSMLSLLEIGIVFVNIGFVLYSEKGIGLHDKLAHTLVIKSDEKEYILKKKLVKEAKVVKEEVKE